MIVIISSCDDDTIHCGKCGSSDSVYQYGIRLMPDYETIAFDGWYCSTECAQLVNTATITAYAQRLLMLANMARLLSSATRSLNASERARAKIAHMSAEAREERARERAAIRAEVDASMRAKARAETDRQNAERARYMAEHANDPHGGVPNMIPKIKWLRVR